MDQERISTIKSYILEFFNKMTIDILSCEVSVSLVERRQRDDLNSDNSESVEVITADININDPQILIGQQGQTLLETQRLLRFILNKKFQENFLFNLDIDGYKKKKIEYLKSLAKEYADQVALTKIAKEFQPMSSYERRIIHGELSNRKDIIVESHGEGPERHIVISPI